MAINKFDTPAQSNYFNTFVPLPLDQITALGMQRQEDLTRKQDLANKLYDQYDLVDYIPNSKDEEYVRQEYHPLLNKAAESMMSADLTNPVEYAKAMRGLKSVGMSDRIRRIEESKQLWNKSQALKQELIARGEYNPLLDEDPAVGWDSSKGLYQFMPKAYKDKASWLDDYYKGIEPDSTSVVNIGGIDFYRSAITRGQLNKISDSYAQSLSSTPYGKDEIKLFRLQNPGLSNNLSDVQVMKTIMDDYSTKYMMHHDTPLSSDLQGLGKRPTINPVSIIPQEVPNGKMNADPAGVDAIFTRTYSAMALAPGTVESESAPIGSSTGPGGFYNPAGTSVKNEVLKRGFKEAADAVIKMYPDMAFPVGKDGKPNKLAAPLSDEEIVNNYKEAQKAYNVTSSKRYRTDSEQIQKALNSSVAISLTDRRVYIPSLQEDISIEEYAKHMGYTMDEFAKLMADENSPQVKILAPSINGDTAGAYSMNVSGNKGTSNKWTKASSNGEVLLSGDDDVRRNFEGLYTLRNVISQGGIDEVPVFNDPNDGSVIWAKPEYSYNYKNGKPNIDIKLSSYIQYKDGSRVLIPGNPSFTDLYGRIISTIYNPDKGRNMNKVNTNLFIRE